VGAKAVALLLEHLSAGRAAFQKRLMVPGSGCDHASNTGGTVGIQALTVTIRSLGVGEVTHSGHNEDPSVGNWRLVELG
jgi:hypothetical protein